METLADSTFHEGLAGSFFGKQGDWFIMAGGSFFPGGKPWQNGIKHYSDQVFVFEQFPDGAFNLVYQGNDLPVPLAEGSYATLPNGLLCVGGLTPDGITGKSWLLTYSGSELTVTEYPSLPLPVRNSTATVIGSNVYLVGGELADGTSSDPFLTLDITNPAKGWEELPNFPVPVSGTTITSQQDGEEMSLFTFGGRAKISAGGATTFYASVYHFRPSSDRWVKRGDIRRDDGTFIPLAMATASSVGGSHILLYGGDTGSIFNRVEEAVRKNDTDMRDSLWINHAGFNNRILVYNIITDAWFEAGETVNPPVAVTSDVSDGKNVYIASGEIRPGVRSPLITQLYYTSQPSFGWINYLVLFLYFGGMLLLGFYFMKRNENTEDFFKASGRIPWWAAGISISLLCRRCQLVFPGLLIAAIFAAAMSTLSSNINSSAAVITSDFYQTLFPGRTFTSQLKVARWSGLLCGLLGMGMALILATWNIASLWDQFNTFLGLLTSGLGALFILGIFFPRVGAKAALIGVIAGLIVLVVIKNNTPLSFLLYGFIGMTAAILIAWATSFLFPNKKEISGFTWRSVSPN